jgi:Flp pilus assembly protein TadD
MTLTPTSDADIQAHHHAALELKAAGRFEEAVVALGKALEFAPRDPRLLTVLGFCLIELNRRREAAQVFDLAIKLDPNSADTCFGYGWSAEGVGALATADSAFRRAITLDPRHADAMIGLANLAVRRRDWRTAWTFAERAAAIDPTQTDAPMTLARVEIGRLKFNAASRRLGKVIELPGLKPIARANARIMMGDALDGATRYPQAFEAYAAGKAELAELFADRFGPGATRPAADGARALMAEFLETPEQAWRTPPGSRQPGAERGHAFLVGFPRSGTTLLEQVLATHADVETLEERPLMLAAEMAFLTRPGGIKLLASTPGEALDPYRQDYWKRVGEFGVKPAGKVLIDKHPLGTVRLPLIHRMFPGAKLLFALRDPRDVVLSCFRRSFNMNEAMYAFNSIEGAAAYYDAVMTAGEAYLTRLSIETHRIRYEDLVTDFDAATRGLCDFLDVPWADQLKNFAKTASNRRVATPSSTQVGRGLYEGGAGQWRHYAFALEPVLPTLRPWIEKFGYDPA